MNFKTKRKENKNGFYSKMNYYKECLNTESYNNCDNKNSYVNETFYNNVTREESDEERNDRNSDEGNFRIITKEVLYKEFDLFHENENSAASGSTNLYKGAEVPHSSGYDWSQQNWVKTGIEASQQGRQKRPVKKRLHRDQRKLVEALKRPAEMSKAESIMLRMGWSGGALGKNGEGIVDPIVPNLAYTSSNVGFGQMMKEQKSKRVKKFNNIVTGNMRKFNMKQNFHMNVLRTILDFMRDDLEVEIVFDANLTKWERRVIHDIVQHIYGEEVYLKNYDSTAQLELMQAIINSSIYTLTTHSVGVDPNRTLHVYKEVPDHIYLITPDDLVAEADAADDDRQINYEHKQNESNGKKCTKQKYPNATKTLNNIELKTNAIQKDKITQETDEYSDLNVITVEKFEDFNIDAKEYNTDETKNLQTKILSTEDCIQIANFETQLNISTSDKLRMESNESIDKVDKQTDVAILNADNEINLSLDRNDENKKDFSNKFFSDSDSNQRDMQSKGNYEQTENVIKYNDKDTDRETAKNDSVEISNDEVVNNILVPCALKKLIEYFIEFASDEYREMRFLGRFDNEQTDLINNFIDNIQWCIRNIDNVKSLFHYKRNEILSAFGWEGRHFEVAEDKNGCCVIYKRGN